MRITLFIVLLTMMSVPPLFAQEKSSEDVAFTVQLQYTVPNLAATRDFFTKLGFTKLEEGPTPAPWVLMTDGSTEYHFEEGKRLTLMLGLGAPRVQMFVKRAIRKGVKFHQVYQVDEEIEDAKCRDPYGFTFYYFRKGAEDSTKMVTPKLSHLGTLSMLRVPSSNADTSFKFYEKLGYKETGRARKPYPEVTIGVGALQVCLMQSPALMRPALVYDAKNYDDRIAELKQLGMDFLSQTPGDDDTPAETVLVAPDAMLIVIRKKAK